MIKRSAPGWVGYREWRRPRSEFRGMRRRQRAKSRFYFEGNGKTLEDFKQGKNIISLEECLFSNNQCPCPLHLVCLSPRTWTLSFQQGTYKNATDAQSGYLLSPRSFRVKGKIEDVMHWRRKWQPTPVFLPGESQGRGSLVGCRLWGCTERTRLKWLSSSIAWEVRVGGLSTRALCLIIDGRVKGPF